MSWDNDDMQDLIAASQRHQIRQGQDEQMREAKKQEERRELARIRDSIKEREDNIEKVRKQAEKGDLDAMESLIRSLFMPSDSQEQLFWIAKASKLGSVYASNKLIFLDLLPNNEFQEIERLVKLAAKTDIYQETSFAIGLGALASLANGKFDQAKKSLQQVVERKDLPHFSYFLGYVLKLQGDAEHTEYPGRYDESSLRGDSPYRLRELDYTGLIRKNAELRVQKGGSQFEDYSILAFGSTSEREARDYLAQAVKLGYPAWSREEVTYYYLRLEDYEQAMIWINICLESDTPNHLANINAINTLIFGFLIPEKQWDDIERFVNIAIEQNVPDQTTNAISNGAQALYLQGKVTESIEQFNVALNREDRFNESEASWWLSEIYKKQGNKGLYKEFKTRSKKAGGYKLKAAWNPF
jgi:hypothetical protein